MFSNVLIAHTYLGGASYESDHELIQKSFLHEHTKGAFGLHLEMKTPFVCLLWALLLSQKIYLSRKSN